jgi:hypothetical protein
MVEGADVKALWLALAYLACTAGFGWLALAMDVHWQQACRARPLTAGGASVLRGLGLVGIATSLLACLRADHASMAALVWVLMLAASALSVALLLTWWPRALAALTFWLRPPAAGQRG